MQPRAAGISSMLVGKVSPLSPWGEHARRLARGGGKRLGRVRNESPLTLSAKRLATELRSRKIATASPLPTGARSLV